MVPDAPVRRRLLTLVLVGGLLCSLATGVAAAQSVRGASGTIVVGLVGFALLGAVPILGGLLELGALLLGLGALVIGLRDAYRRRSGDGPADRQSTLDESFDEAAS